MEACILSVIDMLDSCPTIAPPPNDPLTMEELRGMDGEPVWLKVRGDDGHYVMFYGFENNRACFYREISRDVEEYGKTWLAYRRKPEGGGALIVEYAGQKVDLLPSPHAGRSRRRLGGGGTMIPLLIVKLKGPSRPEDRAAFMRTAAEGIRAGTLILSDECDVLAFDETGRMVYPAGRRDDL